MTIAIYRLTIVLTIIIWGLLAHYIGATTMARLTSSLADSNRSQTTVEFDRPIMTEGTIKIINNGGGRYSVFTDAISGEMEYVGAVEKVDRPMMETARWHAIYPGGKSGPFTATRRDAAEMLARG
jgi:hypothetical protein